MEIILYLFATFGLAFFIKEKDGPFDLMNKIRVYLLSNKYVGVFFYKLLDCYFCISFHTGWIIYLTTQKEWHLNLLFCWALAGAVGSLILSKLLERLSIGN